MSRLAGAADGVIGVDTHRDTLAAAVTDMVGGLLARTSVSADAAGYHGLSDFAQAQVPGRRCWAVEAHDHSPGTPRSRSWLPGVGLISAAQVLVSWSHAGRLRNDPETRAYAARRTAEGKCVRDIRRCLKRMVARQLFKALERYDRSAVELANFS